MSIEEIKQNNKKQLINLKKAVKEKNGISPDKTNRKKYQDGNLKLSCMNNYIEYKWANYYNKKADIVRLDKSLRFSYRLFTTCML